MSVEGPGLVDLGLFEQAPCGYAVLDSTGLVLEVNAELLRLVGRDRDEVVGRLTLPGLCSVGGRIYFDTHIFPMLALGAPVREVALDLVHADGSRVPVLLNANADSDTDGDTDGTARGPCGAPWIRAVVLETRDRRRYERDLLDAVQAAQEAQRAASRLAETLQGTLIPPTPPRIEGLELAGAYRPAGDGSIVGGDFYDVFQVADHEWVLAIGDVLGKGIAAATVTAFVRHTLRDLAMQVRDPAELLAHLDRALTANPTDRYCTLAVVRIRAQGGDWLLEGSVGGHPLPLVRHPDGTVEELGRPGSLVGILSDPTFSTFRHLLGDGLVVLYTDGVTEARRDRVQFGEERLRRLVADAEPDPGRVTQSIVEAVLAYQDGNATDDIAVMALRRDVQG